MNILNRARGALRRVGEVSMWDGPSPAAVVVEVVFELTAAATAGAP